MNKWFFIAIVFSVLLGCSKHSDTDISGTERVIHLSAQVNDEGKVVKNNTKTALTFNPVIMGWEFPRGYVDYHSAGAWNITPEIPLSGSTSVIRTDKHYSADKEVYTYIKSWYPKGTKITNGIVYFDSPSNDGTDDVLYATEISGGINNPISEPLIYKHLLTRIQVSVVKTNNSAYDIRVKNIRLKDARLPKAINLLNDRVIYGDTVMLNLLQGSSQLVTTTPAVAGRAVMVQPYNSNVIRFEVETDKAVYANVQARIDNDAYFIPGKAYMITLTFLPPNTDPDPNPDPDPDPIDPPFPPIPPAEPLDINATAKIIHWELGAPGTGEVY